MIHSDNLQKCPSLASLSGYSAAVQRSGMATVHSPKVLNLLDAEPALLCFQHATKPAWEFVYRVKLASKLLTQKKNKPVCKNCLASFGEKFAFLCFAGSLPSSWSKDTSLQSIIVALNKLTGTLPDSWSQLSALVNLDVRSNNLSGPVPDSWRGSAAPGVLPASGMTSLVTL